MKIKRDSGKPGKRPMRALTYEGKIDAINRVHNGESKASVARDIGVPESTLRGWCKSESKIREAIILGKSSSSGSDRNSPLLANGNSAAIVPGNNYFSEDNGPPPKKPKTDHQSARSSNSSFGINENLENNATRTTMPNMTQAEVAQLATVMARLKEDPAMFLQLQGMNSPYSLPHYANAFYEYSMRECARQKNNNNNNNISASLVANGLQYSLGSKNKSINGVVKPNGTHALNYGRRSLPSTLDNQATLAPVSPRTSPGLGRESKSKIRNPAPNNQARNYSSNFNNNNLNAINNNSSIFNANNNNIATANNNNNIINNNNSNSYGLNDQILRYKIPQQQQAVDMASTAEANSNNQESQVPAWSKDNEKQSAVTSTSTPPEESTLKTTPTSTMTKKSINSKNRATLDKIFLTNSVNVMSSINATAGGANEDADDEPVHDNDKDDDDEENKPELIGKAEAIKHAKKFLSYLIKNMDTTVTLVQIMQFQKLLVQVENAGSELTEKQVRKNSPVVRYSSAPLEVSVNSE